MRKMIISILLCIFLLSSLFSSSFNKEIFEQFIGKRVVIYLKNYRNQQNDGNGSFNEWMFLKEVHDDYIICSDFKKSNSYYYILIEEISGFFVF